jgi:PAS domain S-box-containing protein
VKRILVVDDKEENQYLLRTLLEGNGLAVELAAHGAEALEKARQHPPALIIADILMPVMDGFTLCREWKQDERLRSVPFVFYTATYTDERDREFALSLGAERFLIKPEEPDTLLAVVRELTETVSPPAIPAANVPMHLQVEAPAERESVYLKQYNQVLIRKLETKMEQLEQANHELEQDIAKRQRTEDKLREAESRYRTLFEQSPDGIVIIDPETARPLEFNAAAHRQLSYTREEFARLNFADIDASDKPEDIRSRIARTMSEGRSDFESLHRTRQGDTRNVHVTAQIVDIQGHPVYHCIWRDITERLKSERLDRRSQRLEAIGTLAGGVAHDLNNALVPILMGVEILRMQYPKESDIVDLFESSAKRAAELVRQLLTFAKGAEGERISIQLAHLAKEMHDIMRGTFPKNIQLVVSCDRDLPTVLGDATQLHQVLLNLCVNARDAMPHGGTLTLEAQRATVDAVTASHILDARPGNYVAVQVRDTGTGIPFDVLDRIFDPFFTTKGPDKGTGLGLSTVMGIVKGQGGFIQVYSQPGQGSTFTVYLPAEGVENNLTQAPKTESVFRGQGETILIVDDEAGMRSVACAVLRRLNFKAVTANDGADGLLQAAKHRADLRAIITDLHMPHMDGIRFIQVLRRMLPNIPVVVTSGLLDEAAAKQFKTLGAVAHLDKPFTESQLAAVLQSIFMPV